jgi:DNA replication protein DnaC
METIKEVVRNIMTEMERPADLPYQPVSHSAPQKRCSRCGNPKEFIWITQEFLIRANGKSGPFWLEMPCPVCQRQERLLQEKEERQKRINQFFDNAMLKKRFIHKRFDNYILYPDADRQKKVFNICKDYARNFDRYYELGTWLLFTGNTGTGKGHLAAAIINEVAQREYTALYAKARGLFRRLKESWKDSSEEKESEIIEKLCQVDLLVIDDIGVQFGSRTEQDFLYDILDGRYEDYKPTICTTNLELKDFEAIVGERNADRFYDRESQSKILVFDWASYRRRDDQKEEKAGKAADANRQKDKTAN